MTISITETRELIAVLVTMFNAAPNAELLTTFADRLEAGETTTDIASAVSDTDEFKSLYSADLTNEDFSANFVASLMNGYSDENGLTQGTEAFQSLLDSGMSRGEAAESAAYFLLNMDTTDAVFGRAAAVLQNKIEVASYFATNLTGFSSDLQFLTEILTSIDETRQSVDTEIALMSLGIPEPDFALFLTVNQDILTGTSDDDVFNAYVFDNQNSAQSEDILDGGAGTDVLFADLGSSQDTPVNVALQMTDIEIAQFRAAGAFQNDDEDSVNTDVIIDAEKMLGVTEFWSLQSNANLTIDNIQESSHYTTLHWQGGEEAEVNFEAYFDSVEDIVSILPDPKIFIRLMDLDGMRSANSPLLDNPYTGFTLFVNGELLEISGESPIQGLNATYQDVTNGINAVLESKGFSSIEATLGSSFSAFNAFDGELYEGTQIIITNAGRENLEAGNWMVNGSLPSESNLFSSITRSTASLAFQLSQVDVVFDHVGSGSKSGRFVAGESSQESSTETGGILQFNISVDRDSHVEEVRSTNNKLEEIFVRNVEYGANGSLVIELVEDVRVFDASEMNNSVALEGTLGIKVSDEATGDPGSASPDLFEKYFSSENTSDNGDQKVDFNYILSESADSLTLSIASEALAIEALVLNIDAAAGNDQVTLIVASGSDTGRDTAEPTDQADLNNVRINMGAGEDLLNLSGNSSVEETIVISDQSFGKNIINNFNANNVNDVLDFSAFLVDMISSSESNETPLEAETDFNVVSVLSGQDALANSITVITDFEEDADNGETFANLTAEVLLDSINDDSGNGHGNLTDNTLNAGDATQDLVGDSRNHIVLIENDKDVNNGEYKVFHLTDGNTADTEFQSAVLLGILNFGESVLFTADNFDVL